MVDNNFGGEVRPPVVPHRENVSRDDQRVLSGSTGTPTNPAMPAMPKGGESVVPDEVAPGFNNQETAVLPRIPNFKNDGRPVAPVRFEPIPESPQNTKKPQSK